MAQRDMGVLLALLERPLQHDLEPIHASLRRRHLPEQRSAVVEFNLLDACRVFQLRGKFDDGSEAVETAKSQR